MLGNSRRDKIEGKERLNIQESPIHPLKGTKLIFKHYHIASRVNHGQNRQENLLKDTELYSALLRSISLGPHRIQTGEVIQAKMMLTYPSWA